MPRVAEIAGAAVFVFPNDHPPPHVHARYQRRVMRLRISDALTLDAGPGLPPRIRRAVVTWLLENRDVAAEAWARYHE
jgi:Domain of unknown function (DUF4160)